MRIRDGAYELTDIRTYICIAYRVGVTRIAQAKKKSGLS